MGAPVSGAYFLRLRQSTVWFQEFHHAYNHLTSELLDCQHCGNIYGFLCYAHGPWSLGYYDEDTAKPIVMFSSKIRCRRSNFPYQSFILMNLGHVPLDTIPEEVDVEL